MPAVDAHVSDAPVDAHVVQQDAPAAPPNDLPSNPTAITDAGTFMEDLTYANDDAGPTINGNGCGASGGKDVFFEITLTTSEVWYFDTFGSNFPTVIRTYPGACQGGAAPNGAVCSTNACGTTKSQLATLLPSGPNCIVIDQNGMTANSSLVLHVERGGRSGTRLATGTATASGTTCGFTNKSMGTCGGVGFDRMYYTTSCPGTTTMLNATTCDAATTYDSVLYVLGPSSTELACNDNDGVCTATTTGASTLTGVGLSGAHLFELIVDSSGGATACGPYNLITTLQ